MHLRKFKIFILLVLGTVFGLTLHPFIGKVVAQVASTEIYACVKDNGLVRISTTITTCGATETLLTWNIQGPQGPEGPQGPQGIQGLQGVAGEDGSGG